MSDVNYTSIELEVFNFNEVKKTSNDKITYVLKNLEHIKRLFAIDYKRPGRNAIVLHNPNLDYSTFNYNTYDRSNQVGEIIKFKVILDKYGYKEQPIYRVLATIRLPNYILDKYQDVSKIKIHLRGKCKTKEGIDNITEKYMLDIICWNISLPEQ